MELEFADEIKHLSKIFYQNGELMLEITQRIKSEWSALGKLQIIIPSRSSTRLKKETFYRQSSTNRKRGRQQVLQYRNWKLCREVRREYYWAQREWTQLIRDRTQVTDVIWWQKYRWTGYLTRRTHNKWTNILMKQGTREAPIETNADNINLTRDGRMTL